MKRIILVSIIVLCFMFVGSLVFSWEINPSQDIRESGNIHGIIDYCGSNGSMGMEIYIPGKSFLVKTGVSGEFTLSHVPEGVYKVMFMLSDAIIGSVSEVQVVKKSITEIGTITICPDNDNDGYDLSQDCDDNNSYIHPGATEVCNGKDDDCDGSVDNDGSCLNCDDSDYDGYYAQPGCPDSLGEDCDDNDNSVNPGVEEVCGDGIDNNCNGEVDEACLGCTPGDPCDPGVDPVGVCTGVTGFYSLDCNCVASYPDDYNIVDICDDKDNDCDGETDEDCIPSNDQDGDGYNSIASGGTDCNDNDPNAHPNATEIPGNGIDEDCNNYIDCYSDNDDDGYGDTMISADAFPATNGIADILCDQDGYFSSNSEDCDDNDNSVNPGVEEVCDDYIDNNCDGNVDEEECTTEP